MMKNDEYIETYPKQHAVRNAPKGTRGSLVTLRFVRSQGVSGRRLILFNEERIDQYNTIQICLYKFVYTAHL